MTPGEAEWVARDNAEEAAGALVWAVAAGLRLRSVAASEAVAPCPIPCAVCVREGRQ
jgi:hypothetical protein